MENKIRLLPSVSRLEPNNRAGLMVFIPSFLSSEECNRVKQLAKDQPESEGQVGVGGKKNSIRNSIVKFVLPDSNCDWLFAKIEAAIDHLNLEYKFALRGFYEGMQVATYNSGGHYDWHSDFGTGSYSVRKLSLSIQLSDQNDYKGGELEFMATDELAPKQIGSLVVFPSFLVHRIRSVTEGQRVSLVAWISGPPFS